MIVWFDSLTCAWRVRFSIERLSYPLSCSDVRYQPENLLEICHFISLFGVYARCPVNHWFSDRIRATVVLWKWKLLARASLLTMKDAAEGKAEKAQSHTQDYGHVNVYPDWAAIQAYYGPRVTIPPYYNSSLPSSHTHAYMWGHPPPLMPPYRAPYGALHPHGGIYCHPTVPIASTQQKVKSLDGPAMSIGSDNETSENVAGVKKKSSQSLETEVSTDRSDGSTRMEGKRSRVGSPVLGICGSSKASSAGGKCAELPNDHEMNTTLVLTNPSSANSAKLCSSYVPGSSSVLPSEICTLNDRDLKRERRKQSNRESARRSRLRKRAETEELGRKVDSLAAENKALRCEINVLEEKSEKLRVENNTLTERLGKGQTKAKLDVSTENLLSRVDDSSSTDRGIGEEVVLYERNYNSGAELRQLLGPSPRADAVAAR